MYDFFEQDLGSFPIVTPNRITGEGRTKARSWRRERPKHTSHKQWKNSKAMIKNSRRKNRR